MTAPSEQRVRHRRRVTKRRAVIGSAAALGLTAGALVTTSLLSSAGAATSWPEATGSKAVSSTIEVSGTYDGKLKKFSGSGDLGTADQSEDQGPLFELEDGAVLKNVIIGTPAADGVHCLGSCTLQNVWWLDVGEDAASFKSKSSSATYKVIGGGAKSASDKVLQFNGAGTLTVTGFQVENFGKLVRSCGNCKTQYKRTVVLSDIDATAPGKALVGINSNYGDTATLSRIRIHGDTKKKIKPCVRFKGNNTGKEPTELGSGPDGTSCKFKTSDVSYE
ncbi:pectate lyase [Streptomyces avermitilis]|uniref:Pectate lyase n=2 Tax=Streptomyces avermitilis TaxID=33903 RepID=Q829M8_STRAW|nr:MULTISPECIES: pectate lyase [Streptomyces]KUN54098.1 pectate lyase [Streptomyces avermitilis]MYT01931.1 pectate lyase [Streptomyces sp. SID5469]OOV11513.1 pectate lyase [Streptomyces avermitilis]BAC74094.1 putative secreted pectate lyase [Streptomyces avermitilis MA-4680 = NBRC 14893]BBJ54623.1 pectate lyase [Streptomyces avermitilis]